MFASILCVMLAWSHVSAAARVEAVLWTGVLANFTVYTAVDSSELNTH